MVDKKNISPPSTLDIHYEIEDRILSQASLISLFEIINGGEMRIQLAANKNQSVITPETIQASMIFLLVSKESNSIASHKPKDRIDLIFL